MTKILHVQEIYQKSRSQEKQCVRKNIRTKTKIVKIENKNCENFKSENFQQLVKLDYPDNLFIYAIIILTVIKSKWAKFENGQKS